jgi:hypothetical protein
MSEQYDGLVLSINKLTLALEQSIAETIFIPFALGLFGAWLGYLFSSLQTDNANRRAEKARIANELLSTIQKLQTDAVAYWCCDHDVNEAQENDLKEAEIHAGIMLVQSMSDELIFKSMTNIERQDLEKELGRYNSSIYDAITGGDFESTSRKSSRNTVKEIVSLSINVRSKISCHC